MTTDRLMDTAQEMLVNGKTHVEVVAALIADGVPVTVATKVVADTDAHPVTKILKGMQS